MAVVALLGHRLSPPASIQLAGAGVRDGRVNGISTVAARHEVMLCAPSLTPETAVLQAGGEKKIMARPRKSQSAQNREKPDCFSG